MLNLFIRVGRNCLNSRGCFGARFALLSCKESGDSKE